MLVRGSRQLQRQWCLQEVLHEQAAGVEGRAALDAIVYRIEGLAVDRQYPNYSARSSRRGAGPRLLDLRWRGGVGQACNS